MAGDSRTSADSQTGWSAQPSHGSPCAGQIITVGYQLMDVTRAALLDGVLTLVISHPLSDMARKTVAGMIRAVVLGESEGHHTVVLPFAVLSRETI